MSVPDSQNRGGITLLLGGARSGKSRRAQELASSSQRVAYIATAQPCDDEMRRKIARHQTERPGTWQTIEAPLELEDAIRAEGDRHDALVIDCLTIWSANLLDHHSFSVEAAMGHVDSLCEALGAAKAKVFIVSNEVGEGVVPAYESGRAFRELLGEMN